MIRIAKIVGVLLAVSVPGLVHAQSVPKGDPVKGRQTFEAYACYSCHGHEGQGSSRDGPRLNPVIPFEALILQVRTPRDMMPPFRKAILSDQQVADIYAYLASLPKPPDPKTIRLLQEN